MNEYNASHNATNGQLQFYHPDSIFIVLGMLIIFFNACVLYVVGKKKALQKSENALLCSLAVSDLTTGAIGIPLSFACTYTATPYCCFCYASVVLFKFVSISTVLHILGIIAERYLQVTRPFTHRRFVAGSGRVKSFVVGVWLISLTVANVPWFWWKVDCDADEALNSYETVYEIICFGVFFVLPFLLITFFLFNICLAARRYFRENSKRCDSAASSSTPKAEIRITVVLFGMFLLFLVCWLPYFYVNVADGLNHQYPMWLNNAMSILRCLTSTINPLIYTFYKEDFYQASKLEAHRLLCCCKKTRKEQARKVTPENTPLVVFESTKEEYLSTLKSEKCQNSNQV